MAKALQCRGFDSSPGSGVLEGTGGGQYLIQKPNRRLTGFLPPLRRQVSEQGGEGALTTLTTPFRRTEASLSLSWAGGECVGEGKKPICPFPLFKPKPNNETAKTLPYSLAWFCLQRNRWSYSRPFPRVPGSTSCPIHEERHRC